MEKKIKIIVDIERMKHPFTGLYYFCQDLALNLLKNNGTKFEYHFFYSKKAKIDLPILQKKIKLIDKLYFWLHPSFKLFHITWQDTSYVPSNKKIKIVYTIHDLNFLYTDKPEMKKKYILEKMQKKIDRADAITVISEFVKQDVLKNLNTRGKEIVVIHNGVDLLEFPDFNDPKYVPQKKYLFSIGTILFKKNFHVMPPLLIGNDYELIIAGIQSNEGYLTFLKAEIEKWGLTDRIKLIGTVTNEEKYWYLKNCEAFVFPSLSEGFGLPPIEAMKLGKPVFLSTYTSLPEIGGKYAYYFQSFDAKAMQATLENGLKDYYQNDRKSAIIEWANQFSWEKATQKYVEVYEKALGIDTENKTR